MSRAFVKDYDEKDPADDLPDRLVSSHPNLVTAAGLARIEAEIATAHATRDAAKAAEDKMGHAQAARDLKYWQTRHATAQVQPASVEGGPAAFGSAVTILRKDGRQQTFRIVGEDEADPSEGSISYVAPLARAVMGKEEGDAVKVAGDEVEILKIA